MIDGAPVFSLVLLATLAAAWVWAEFRAGVALRIASGTVLIGFLVYAAYYIGWLGPQYTITFYEDAVRRSMVALKHGRSEVVIEAFEEYASQPKPHPNTINARLEKAGFNQFGLAAQQGAAAAERQ